MSDNSLVLSLIESRACVMCMSLVGDGPRRRFCLTERGSGLLGSEHSLGVTTSGGSLDWFLQGWGFGISVRHAGVGVEGDVAHWGVLCSLRFTKFHRSVDELALRQSEHSGMLLLGV